MIRRRCCHFFGQGQAGALAYLERIIIYFPVGFWQSLGSDGFSGPIWPLKNTKLGTYSNYAFSSRCYKAYTNSKPLFSACFSWNKSDQGSFWWSPFQSLLFCPSTTGLMRLDKLLDPIIGLFNYVECWTTSPKLLFLKLHTGKGEKSIPNILPNIPPSQGTYFSA